jgi:hypothetical protein
VACFNIQPLLGIHMQERVGQWESWRDSRGFTGRLFNDPCKPYEDTFAKGVQAAQQMLANYALEETAVFCTTEPAAIGLVRALSDRGLAAGRYLSIVTVNDMGLARHLSPSLTALEVPDPGPYVAVALEWMARGGGEWIGPLCVGASDVPLCVGESSAPPRPNIAASPPPNRE